MGKHSGDADLNFFELKNAKVHVYTAQPTWTAADEGRLIYVTSAEPDPAKRGFFRGTSSAWVAMGAGGSGGVDVEENGTSIVVGATPLDFQTDEADGRAFAKVIDDGGAADIEIDKQINHDDLAGSVGPVPTGFVFDATVYRACEVIYTIEKETGELETGHIMILHDGSNAGVVVTRIDTSAAAFGGGAAGVVFSADIDGNDCRLLYTETNGDKFNFQAKPRPIRINTPPAPQTVTVAFASASSFFDASVVASHNINVEITTSDGLALAAPVSVDVRDLLTGSGTPGVDYNMATPQTLNWSAGEANGTAKSAVIDVLGNNSDETVDLDLDNASGATEGAQNTHTVNLISAGAS